MGPSGSGIYEENHIASGSWIACLIDDSIGAIFFRTILSVPFCPLPFCPRTVGPNVWIMPVIGISCM